jgi:DNA-binding transcriptional regulator YhcF (GntR family)
LQWKFNGNRPVYIQIMEQVRGAILTGEFPPGGRVPPVRDLAAQAQVNPNTMQRALLELEREGLVISRGTMGRFVTQNPEILQTMRQAAQDAVIRECAAQLKAAGITIVQAAQMLLALNEEEENHG